MELISPAGHLENLLMDTNQLLTASALDIIFDGRNKDYGAYCLRKDYNKRLKVSMISTGIAVTVIILLYSFNRPKQQTGLIFDVSDTVMLQPPPVEDEPEFIPPPKPIEPPPPIATIQFTTPPRIVPDNDVSPDEMPPVMDDAADLRIDLISKDGIKDDFGLVPPQGTSNGVIGGLSELRNNEDSIYIGVQIESTYPGGSKAWSRFLNKTFSYPQNAADNQIEGAVIIKFVVDLDGTLSNIEAISGPEDLRSEAIRVIKKSGKWIPAIQNGRTVKSYKQQPIVFKLNDE